jgi:hypothetical protein
MSWLSRLFAEAPPTEEETKMKELVFKVISYYIKTLVPFHLERHEYKRGEHAMSLFNKFSPEQQHEVYEKLYRTKDFTQLLAEYRPPRILRDERGRESLEGNYEFGVYPVIKFSDHLDIAARSVADMEQERKPEESSGPRGIPFMSTHLHEMRQSKRQKKGGRRTRNRCRRSRRR